MTVTSFGHTSDGTPVDQITLTEGDLRVTLLTYGAIVQDLRLAGVDHSLTWGADSMAAYETTHPYHGALIGPVANRITGAKSEVSGRTYAFAANDGPNSLHSGPTGTHAKVWTLADQSETHALLTVTLPDGEGGFPGTRMVSALFEVTAPATLSLTITGQTDADTLLNFANHSYWTLDGTDTVEGHRLKISADHYTPADAATLPTGEVRTVEGTPFDYRQGHVFAGGEPPLDTNFCLSDHRMPLREVLTLTGQSGVQMRMATTEPGVQIYDDRPHYRALAIEAQCWPDAPKHPNFPSIFLRRGDSYEQHTQWSFAKGAKQ